VTGRFVDHRQNEDAELAVIEQSTAATATVTTAAMTMVTLWGVGVFVSHDSDIYLVISKFKIYRDIFYNMADKNRIRPVPQQGTGGRAAGMRLPGTLNANGSFDMSIPGRLSAAAFGVHLADQIALVSVPLVAALVFHASPQTIGVLVACQSLAYLLGSIPFGLLVDGVRQRPLAIASTLLSLLGFSGAAIAVATSSLAGFGLFVTVAGFGVVLFVLTALSILPKVVAPGGLARANSGLEFPRALCSFAVPLAVGLAISSTTAAWVFALAALGATGALSMTLRLPDIAAGRRTQANPFRRIIEGGAFVLRHTLLLPISLCAILWNLAFSGLLVVLVPLVRDVYGFAPGAFGMALSAFGLAAILGTWTAGRFAGAISPNAVLLFGPGSSVAAVLGLASIPAGGPEIALYGSFFLLGFGPSMWLIAQNSVRQLVTPEDMLGRVNAVIQTAIYGVRPLGAVIGGLVVGATSPRAGLAFVAICFCLSTAASVFSGLRSVRSYAELGSGGA